MRHIIKSLPFLALLLLLNSANVQAQKSFAKQLQTQLIMAEDGDTIHIKKGKFVLTRSLTLDGKKNIVLIGKGKDQSVLSFKDQAQGAEGLKITNCENILLKGFAVEDASGDAIKVQKTKGISFVDVRTEWLGKPNEKNGAYGLYPVQCESVFIDDCVAIGASDAGIYVGQSDKIIIRNSRAEFNVAGIEIENSSNAEVYDCLAQNNTGGILVFDLPGLIKKKGGNVRIYHNKVIENNYRNFAPKGNIVGEVPPGTGMMILAASEVEIFENEVLDNRTSSIVVASYLITQRKYDDPEYDPYPSAIHIHDNLLKKGKKEKMRPTFKNKMGILFWSKSKKHKVPHIVFDGIWNKELAFENGNYIGNDAICIHDNINEGILFLDAGNGFDGLHQELEAFNCTLKNLPALDFSIR